MHTVTCKLNQDARLYPGEKGTTFFIGLGEKHYNYKTKQSGYTNYDAAIFAKDSQIQFYTDNLKSGCVVSVSGSSIILESYEHNGKTGMKLVLQDAKLTYCFNPAVPMPDNVRQQAQQQAPPAQPAPQQQAPPIDDMNQDIPW